MYKLDKHRYIGIEHHKYFGDIVCLYYRVPYINYFGKPRVKLKTVASVKLDSMDSHDEIVEYLLSSAERDINGRRKALKVRKSFASPPPSNIKILSKDDFSTRLGVYGMLAFLCWLTALFALLKMFNLVSWSWWWVFSPIGIPTLIAILLLIVGAVMYLLRAIKSNKK